jgi:hypothetical protein
MYDYVLDPTPSEESDRSLSSLGVGPNTIKHDRSLS